MGPISVKEGFEPHQNNDGIGNVVQLSTNGWLVGKQRFKNWTLVVTMRGASQFSDINLTLSVSLSAARLE